jgi:hypothetical protein
MLRLKAVATLIVTLAVLTLVGIVTAQKADKLKKDKQLVSQEELQKKQKQKEDRDTTPIQEGVMTTKQRKHSKLFEVPGAKRLQDLADNGGNVDSSQEVPMRITPHYASLNAYLQGLTCKADAIVVGIVKSKSSQLTEQGTSIFTDYDLSVENVYKDNAAASLQPGTDITVTRFGGAVKLNGKGRVLRATSETERPLKVGDRYVLFLKFIPETGAYSSVAYTGDNSFELKGDSVKQVSNGNLPFGPNTPFNANTFTSEVQSSLSLGCGN